MRLNRGMRLPSRVRMAPVALIAVALLMASCGRSGYQYVDNADETVFIKIPEDWSVVSEGAVNWTITPPSDDEIQPIIGEFVLPWRAEFAAAPDDRRSSDYVQGFVEVQPVDRRLQADLSFALFFPELSAVDEVEVLRHELVTVGDASGHRVASKSISADGEEIMGDRLVMTNSLNSVVYTVWIGCAVGCYNTNAISIEEVMSTFTVEG